MLVTLWGDCLFPRLLFLLDCGLLEDGAWQRAGGQDLLVFLLYLSSLLPMAESSSCLPNIYFSSFLSNRNLGASPEQKKKINKTKQQQTKLHFPAPLADIGQVSEVQAEVTGRGFWENILKGVNTAWVVYTLWPCCLLLHCCLELSCNGCSTSSHCV